MPNYIVIGESSVMKKYEVTASNEDQAIDLILDGVIEGEVMAESEFEVLELEMLLDLDADYDDAKNSGELI